MPSPPPWIGGNAEFFRGMLTIRVFEEEVRRLRLEGQIVGSVHLCIGQEAIYVGACAALTNQDLVFATYRGHGWALARGVPSMALFAEMLGKSSGVNGGRGGSAFLSAPAWGFYGENSIVGGGAPVAVGAALAARFDGSNRVVIGAFGDGAMNQGSVHEALNFAAVFDLPVVFVLENNGYSELTPIADMVKNDRLYARSSAYGMPGCRVDGNNPEHVRAAVHAAAARARAGLGPTLVECMTERLVGHYIGDPELYRKPGELDRALKRDPLVLAAQLVDSDQATHISTEVHSEIADALASALAQPFADPLTVLEYLYA